jgi:hypothetical protein
MPSTPGLPVHVGPYWPTGNQNLTGATNLNSENSTSLQFGLFSLNRFEADAVAWTSAWFDGWYRVSATRRAKGAGIQRPMIALWRNWRKTLRDVQIIGSGRAQSQSVAEPRAADPPRDKSLTSINTIVVLSDRSEQGEKAHKELSGCKR